MKKDQYWRCTLSDSPPKHLKGDLICGFVECYEVYVRLCLVDTRFSREVLNAYEGL